MSVGHGYQVGCRQVHDLPSARTTDFRSNRSVKLVKKISLVILSATRDLATVLTESETTDKLGAFLLGG